MCADTHAPEGLLSPFLFKVDACGLCSWDCRSMLTLHNVTHNGINMITKAAQRVSLRSNEIQ